MTLLATFVLPMLQILAESRVKATRYTQKRTAKALAQQKLYDHIHYVETALDHEGTFEEEGYPTWTWEIPQPEMRAQGDQVVLEYKITIFVPLRFDSSDGEGGGGGDNASFTSTDEGSTYEYTVWTLPSNAWYEEQNELYFDGQPSLLHGDPTFDPYSTLGGEY